MALSDLIREKIMNEGPVSFRDYMEMALYYPELGYYTCPKDKIGPAGDFYTSSNLTPAFGAMIARQIEEMWTAHGYTPFTIVEYGAGTGYLCHDILDYLKNNKALYDQLHYCIIERSPAMQAKEKSHLNEKVSWYDSIREVPAFTGCILSNELVDNFPVHKVIMEDELMEVYIDYKNGFTEILKPARNELKEYLEELEVYLPKGFCTEINLEAIRWIREMAPSMQKGYVITIDYGHLSSRLYHECRNQGTLVCYNNHQMNNNLYQDIGNQDITSHVNFSALKYWGEKNGLEYCGFTDQAGFLVSLGFSDYLQTLMVNGENIVSAARTASVLNHKLLIDMGNKFKVLIQCKNTDHKDLTGLGHFFRTHQTY